MKYIISLIFSSMLIGLSPLSASLVVSDSVGFGTGGYTVGSLDTQNPAISGTNGAWDSNDSGAFSQWSVTSGSLNYSNYGSEGGKITWTRDNDYTDSYYVSTRPLDSTAMLTNTAGNTTLWASFLVNYDNLPARTMLNVGTGFHFGLVDGKATMSGNVIGTTFNLSGTTTYEANETHLVMLKVTQGGTSDTAQIFVDPDLSLGEPTVAELSQSGTNFVFNSGITVTEFSLEAMIGSASVDFDEIRIGTEFSDMVIPEPSTYALLFGVGTLALALARRKFRA